MTEPLLEVNRIESGYGASQVLFDVSLQVGVGQCVSLQGRNGMGKTTTISAIMGWLPCWRGEVRWQARPIHNQPSHTIAQLGIGLVPEGRQVFPNLTVWENLVATARLGDHDRPWTVERVFDLFPKLAERRKNFGDQLSGGEQQMLAIGRALMTNPKLLILDEATEGLSPLLRQEIWQALAALKAQGLSILITDKNLKQLLTLCDHHVILQKGRVVWTGTSQAFRADPGLRQKYLSA
ncbi:MAG: ABC transporter ATP-binding protein [Burkholderiaceae bacterium]|nr:ABC transporter ATP-binding protein [Burkholderiaceae bacterium]MCD8517036.1 ABC transporter ATP-binding protein [Burkholderiaceae bacterium]MCD8536918.1 ABC transporter ATP-binding protein [Burkholderiaceae bacterium]MCD8566056.1 ABC transporter ATP-binding protein [Burkholderiaceae bacterium]